MRHVRHHHNLKRWNHLLLPCRIHRAGRQTIAGRCIFCKTELTGSRGIPVVAGAIVMTSKVDAGQTESGAARRNQCRFSTWMPDTEARGIFRERVCSKFTGCNPWVSGVDALAHTHLLVQHLLKQLERHAATRHERDHRPAWLVEFIARVAEHFVPLSGVGRVGCECEADETGWEARLFLGAAEVVGGKDDGQHRGFSFELHLNSLLACFSNVRDVTWNVAASAESPASFITVRGEVEEHPVRVKAYSRAPSHAGPALWLYDNGRVQPVE